MTLKEFECVIKAKKKRMEDEMALSQKEAYNSAYLTATFVGYILNGKKIPSFESCFGIEVKQDNQAIIMKEKMIDFVNKANRRIGEKNGT